jgi:hypothetical protein
MPFNQLDAGTKRSFALPNGAAATTSPPLDLEHNNDPRHNAGFLADCEAIISAPALTTGELGDGDTMKYSLESDWDTSFAAAVSLTGVEITQIGAGGAGAPAATQRIRIPPDVARHLRLRAVNSGAGNASGKSASFVLAF